ncbi:MAG: Ig-like domain-containing protein, partial [Paludibacter sp.]
MKKSNVLLLCFLLFFISLSAQTLVQKFYFDFGPIDVTNGDITINPDINANYWNNLPNLSGSIGTPSFSSLKNSANGSTSYGLIFTVSGFITNGKLNGALLSPVAANFGADADMAIATATEDYIYNTSASGGPSFKLTGLDPLKQYRFKIFASRNVTTTRTSQYTLQGAGAAVVGTLNSSTTGTGANLGTIYTSSYISPSSAGEISITTVTTTPASDNFAYINCMKMEEYAVNQVDATSISIAGNDIISSGATSQMSVVYVPSNASIHTITWSVDDTSVATINSNGLLTPKKNGTVTVSASFVQNAQTISATKQINISNQTTELYVSGTATTNGDNPATALQMNPTVGITGVITKGEFEFATTLNASGTLKFHISRTDANASVYGAGASAGTILSGGTAITPGVSGPVLIKVYLASNTYKVFPINALKISQMGSSVSYGSGATSNHGYAYLFTQVLAQRYSLNLGANWLVSNISVPGNNTINVLNRWDNDLLNDNSKYVVYALSLGNEGIVGGGQSIFDQFKNNMILLINKAKSVGKMPIIANCYTRADYGTSEYNYVKQMNMLIHDWDVA